MPFTPDADSLAQVMSAPFAISLIYVSYAYSGFNAAAYFQAEVRDAERTVPKALVIGTLIVALLYVALNWIFLRTTPIADSRISTAPSRATSSPITRHAPR